MSAEKLYQKVKSGQIKLDQLNDAGKEALRGYMAEKQQKTVNTVKSTINTGKLVTNVVKKVATKFGGELKTAVNDAAERGRQVQTEKELSHEKLKSSEPPILKFLGNLGRKINDTPVIGPALDWLEGADKKVSDFKSGALDTGTIGLTRGIGNEAIKNIPGGKENITPILNDRLKKTPYKAGQFAGYIAPGAAADRLIVKVGSPVLKKLPKVLQGLVRGAASGALDTTAQEGGDVAFRGGSFDPENIAIGAGAGGTLGAAVPLISNFAKSVGNKSIKSLLGNNLRQIDALDTASLPQTIRRGAGSVNAPTSRITPEVQPVGDVDVNWWNRLFGDQGLGITANAGRGTGRTVTTEQQIVDNPLRQNVSGLIDSTKQNARAAYQNTVDSLSPLKQINRETYETAMDAARSNNIANTIIHDKFVDNQGNVIGNSLNDIMKKTRGLGKKFDDYLVLRHAETRMARGERVYDDNLSMTPEKARAAADVLEARYPGLKELGDEWDTFNGNVLDSAVREGLISEASRTAMREQNPHYASMNRQFSSSEKRAIPRGSRGGFSGQSAPIKNVSPTGSTRKIVSPIRSAVEQVQAWKQAELRNRTMQEIVKAIQDSPEGMKGVAEIVKKPTTSYKNLDDALRDGGSEEFLDMLDNDFRTLFTKTKTGEENIVRAMINGQPVYVRVHNPEAVKALVGMGSDQAGLVMQMARKLSNATKRGATGTFAPMFAVKSLIGDTVQAAVQSNTPIRHLFVDAPSAFISSLVESVPGLNKVPGLKNLGKLAEEFRRSGGEYSALLMGDRGVKKGLSQLRREPLLSARGVSKGVVNTVKAPFKALEKVADVSENMNRMAAYRRAIVGKERTPENIRNAIKAARESTVNFSRKGNWTKELESFVPYTNAAVQGSYRLARALIKNPIKTSAAISTLVIGPKLYEYAQFNDDPDYQRLPARERYRNLIIKKNADGTFAKIPIDPSYEAFGALFTDVLNKVVNNDPEAFKGTMDSLAESWTPPLVSGLLKGVTQGGGIEKSLAGGANSTVFAPAVSIIGNQSFTGAPIVPERLKGNSPEFQYDEKTSGLGKVIGEKLNFSPIKVDYLLRAYGGDPSRLLLPLTSQYGGGTAQQTLFKNFIADPVFTTNLSNDFYVAKDAYAHALNDNKDFGKSLPSWFSQSDYDLINSRKKGSPSAKLTDLNTEKREVMGNTSLSKKEKADTLREIQVEINDIYADVNSQLQDNGFKFPSR